MTLYASNDPEGRQAFRYETEKEFNRQDKKCAQAMKDLKKAGFKEYWTDEHGCYFVKKDVHKIILNDGTVKNLKNPWLKLSKVKQLWDAHKIDRKKVMKAMGVPLWTGWAREDLKFHNNTTPIQFAILRIIKIHGLKKFKK